MESRRCHILASGRVQGVGYRFFARDSAQALGLSGWVRNTHGGGVEVEVEGEPGAIDKFIEGLRQGPPLSRVLDVETQEMAATGAGGEFFIRR
ncbi:MAG: acylphosphatase [Chitinispirillales bacterium]|jgi:acylphosphatase|nr:acylphosphatase [Chitinispirillales bacterium]